MEGDGLETFLLAALKFLAQSQARILLVNLEDLWLEQAFQNMPGTGDERPNWRRKAALSLEQIKTDPRVLGVLKSWPASEKKGGTSRRYKAFASVSSVKPLTVTTALNPSPASLHSTIALPRRIPRATPKSYAMNKD